MSGSRHERPVFVPLYRRFFDAFADGSKTVERRRYGPRWNERVCRVGRAVTLSAGYGKTHRLSGIITSFEQVGSEARIGISVRRAGIPEGHRQ